MGLSYIMACRVGISNRCFSSWPSMKSVGQVTGRSCSGTRCTFQAGILGPKNHMNTRILQTIISGLPHELGLRTRISEEGIGPDAILFSTWTLGVSLSSSIHALGPNRPLRQKDPTKDDFCYAPDVGPWNSNVRFLC